MGSSDFSATVLRNLLLAEQKILAIYTSPDKSAGRGMRERMSPVKLLAQEYGIPVRQPKNFRNPDDVEQLAALKPDFLVVASYGVILPEDVLNIPAIAPLNIHPSLLPLYRGAAPIQRAIQENWKEDSETGVAVMHLVSELDAGPVYGVTRVPIGHATCADLSETLAQEGSKLLIGILPLIQTGLKPVPQEHVRATYAKKLGKEEGRIDWNRGAAEIDALIRAMNPWPGTTTEIHAGETRLPVIVRAAKIGEDVENALPGQLKTGKKGISIACLDKWLDIERIQMPGRKEMSAIEFANGLRLKDTLPGHAF